MTRNRFFAALVAALLSPFYLLAELRKPRSRNVVTTRVEWRNPPKYFWLFTEMVPIAGPWPAAELRFQMHGIRNDGAHCFEPFELPVGISEAECWKRKDEAWDKFIRHLRE